LKRPAANGTNLGVPIKKEETQTKNGGKEGKRKNHAQCVQCTGKKVGKKNRRKENNCDVAPPHLKKKTKSEGQKNSSPNVTEKNQALRRQNSPPSKKGSRNARGANPTKIGGGGWTWGVRTKSKEMKK